MSKLIEALKTGAVKGSSEKKTSYELIQEKLSDVYFPDAEKSKKSEYPVVIRVVEKQGISSLVPWIIASVAFLITALSLFSTKRIFIDVKVIDEKNPYVVSLMQTSRTGEAAVPHPSPLQSGDEDSLGKISLKDVVFEGASELNSSSEKSGLTLVNSSVANFARAQLNFRTPVNMEGSKIVLYAKGRQGGENLALALKDSNHVLAFEKGKLFPFPDGLSSEWQKVEIPLTNVSKEFNPRKVESLRFEFGSKDIHNKPGDTVLVKDLRIVPA